MGICSRADELGRRGALTPKVASLAPGWAAAVRSILAGRGLGDVTDDELVPAYRKGLAAGEAAEAVAARRPVPRAVLKQSTLFD